MKKIFTFRSHGGEQALYRHPSTSTGTDMEFSVFVPGSWRERPMPVVYYLSGLTCTSANVTEKGEFRRACAELGLVFVAPDTSPRGAGVPGDPDNAYDFGLGAGFYVDATQAPYSSNYRMWSYVTEELPELIAASFPVDNARCGVMGHSMGGHGALIAALRCPDRYRSVSAFAPIVSPSSVPWGHKAFGGYLGNDRAAWQQYDAVQLIASGARVPKILVDQGAADTFLDTQLRPQLLEAACQTAGIELNLRRREGYDHSYYFISSFMSEHLKWHAEQLV